MGKIVGKIFIICISFITFFVDARIYMEVRTENGTGNRVVVGQPFTLDVVIDEVHGSIPAPTIQGLNNFVARQSGSYMSSINGKATARYSYQVRIDTIGSYILGPATITHQQQQLVSNEVRVDVVKDVGVVQQNNKSSKAADSKTFLRLMIDSESVVVGQKIGCVLRFYYQDPSMTLVNIGAPELPGFDVKEGSQLEHGSADLEGVEYRYVQWRWDIYPIKPGEFLIPAYNADYDVPSKDNHLLSGFLMLLGNRAERKRVYSNAITIKVSPLPHCDTPVHAVGVFERFSAEIKPGMAKQGEGMVLTIDIEGNGNLQAIATPLLNLPSSLKYYDSNNSIIAPKHSDELPKKRFEFIIQGLKSGEYDIPEQLFTYFDIETNQYVTLRTSPLAVSIKPGVAHTKKNEITHNFSAQEDMSDAIIQEQIGDINKLGQWYPDGERKSLPWWLFELLLLIPCLYIVCPFVLEKLILLTGNNIRLARRRAFGKARKQINHAIKNADDKNLYTIFITLLQQLEQEQKLHVEMPIEWTQFFEQITHAAYAQSDNKNNDELCRVAKQWLERLEKII